MNAELILREPLGERSFAAADFPLSIGGEGSVIVVPAPASGPIAWIAQHDGQLFVQPSGDEAVRAAQRLAHHGLDVAARRRRPRRRRRPAEAARGRAAAGCSTCCRAVRTTRPRRRLPSASASVSGEGADDAERIDPVAFRPPAARAPGLGAGRCAASRSPAPPPCSRSWPCSSSPRRPWKSRSTRRRSAWRSRAAGPDCASDRATSCAPASTRSWPSARATRRCACR